MAARKLRGLAEPLRLAARALSGRRWALVGGVAVGARCQPRTTRDIDIAVSVGSDAEAEGLIFELQQDGFRVISVLEHARTGRLATARLAQESDERASVLIDLLFASCGIEPETVAAATMARALGELVPVASVAHLIAMKVLARDDDHRPQDWDDLAALTAVATPADLEIARGALALILERGYDRGRDLLAELERFLRRPRSTSFREVAWPRPRS